MSAPSVDMIFCGAITLPSDLDILRALLVDRFLLGLYPRRFRDRFATDLEADFADLLRARGTIATWLRVVPDLVSVGA